MSRGGHQVNGTKEGSKYIDSFDVDDPEFVRQLRRPVEVKQDVRQMEERKRVNMILKSKSFRQELDTIVVEQLKKDKRDLERQQNNDQTLKEISSLLPPSSQSRILRTSSLLGGSKIIPIADFSGIDVSRLAKGEKLMRNKLSACCRLIDMFGWSHGNQSHITASLEHEQYLVVGSGQLYNEVTAGGLIKVDAAGNVLDQGSTLLAVDHERTDLNIAVHESKNNILCVIFLNNPSVVSVSSMECGLLPLSQDAMSLGEVKVVDYGAAGDCSSRDIANQAFNQLTKVVLLRNCGALVGGESVEEAFHVARSLMNAVDTQLRTIPIGLENICLPSEATRRKAYERANRIPSGDDGKRKWKRGELEFEALMRHLENSGYRTGYVFHAPLTRQAERTDRVNAEVELPPSSTSFAYGEDEMNNSMKDRKNPVKADWLNSPNAYKKEEIEEKGAPKAKKITKWVPENGPGALIKIDNPNQFAPIGTDPKELKAKFRAIRKDHFDENITAGPQSRILEGVTWEEAQRIKEGNVQSDTIIVVGAASRGIIQRDNLGSAAVYKAYYAPNPFDNVTEEDVEEYKAEILKKTKGADSRALTTDEDEVIVPGPDGRLISSDERMQQVRQTQAEVPLPTGAGRHTPEAALQSPTRSTSSVEGQHGDRSGTEGGTETESATPASGSEKKKKKRGFRMPSFSSKKKDKQ